MHIRKLLTLVSFTFTLILFAGCGAIGGGREVDPACLHFETGECPEPPPVTEAPTVHTTTTNPQLNVPTTTTPSLDLPTAEPQCEQCSPWQELEALSDDECAAIDAYDYIGPSEPEVLPSGAAFYFDCSNGVYDWYFDGAQGDAWHTRFGDVNRRISVEGSGIPTDRHHPAYPDSLTLGELYAGLRICVHDPDHPARGNHEHVVSEVVVYTYSSSLGHPLPAYDTYNGGLYDLMFSGVLPYPNGKWSFRYMTAGPCS